MKEFTTSSLQLPFIFRLIWSETDSFSKRRWIYALLLLVGSSTFAAVAPVALKLAIDGLATPASPAHLATATLVGAYVLCHWLSRCAGEVRWALYGPARQRLQRRVSLRVFAHIMALPFRFHVDRKTGAVSQTLTQGVTGCQVILDQALLSVLPVIIEFAVITVILIRLDQPVVLYVFGAASVLYTATFALAVKRIGQQSRNASSADIDCSAALTDSILNYEVVKYFNAEAFVRDGYESALAKAESGWVRLFQVMASNGVAIATVFGASLAASVGYAAHEVARGSMTIGDFVLVNAYMLQVVRPLELLGAALQSMSRGLGFVAKMLELIKQEPEPGNPSRPIAHPVGGCLRFDCVSFSYSAGSTMLRDVSFTIPRGGTLAVVGASGVGKSSLVRLLMRLYEPDRGRILLDEIPISEMSPYSVRASIAVVPQDTILFNDTIAYNIAFGRPGATKEEIERAAKVAHLHEFVETLPAGYDTVVGERGVKLSGGERQRVAIARAALKRPRIYVFDEATASLDTPTERAILHDLVAVSRGCTTLAIAHRLSTISHADEIIVLERGTVVERGTHASLIKANGSYAAAWRAQQDAIQSSNVRALSFG